MISLLWAGSPRIRDFLARWMPTNGLLAAIRTRGGLKLGVPAMALGVVYFLLAAAAAGGLLGLGWLGEDGLGDGLPVGVAVGEHLPLLLR
ncbi:MAG: hypothetical protein LBH48_00620 [Bifidobacteriaceae bacterium]|jgi:hypothetical protein|nr:hypothetical protein [Bifidobacteriaceae bacterium]